MNKVTQKSPFYAIAPGDHLFTVTEGVNSKQALIAASELLEAIGKLTGECLSTGEPLSTLEAHLVNFAAVAADALVASVTGEV